MHININVSSIDSFPTDILKSNLIQLFESNQLRQEDITNVHLYFSDDTLRDVLTLQKDKGLPVIGQSQHAIGKVLDYIENGDLHHAIFLDYNFFSPFIFKDINEAHLEAFLINHELGHIYEHNLTAPFMPPNNDFEQVVYTRKEFAQYSQSTAIFSEYIANTYAINSLRVFSNTDEKFKDIFNHFCAQLYNYIEEIPQLITEAKNEASTSRDCRGIQKISYRLLYFEAQVIGLYEGLGAIESSDDLAYQEFLKLLEDSFPKYISESFNELGYALHKTLTKSDKWENYTFLNNVNKVINDFWLKCGFESDDRLYFKVIE